MHTLFFVLQILLCFCVHPSAYNDSTPLLLGTDQWAVYLCRQDLGSNQQRQFGICSTSVGLLVHVVVRALGLGVGNLSVVGRHIGERMRH